LDKSDFKTSAEDQQRHAWNLRLLPAVLLGPALPACSSLAGADDLATLRSSRKGAGTQAQWEAVAPDRIRYRLEQRFSRTVEVDYMVARGGEPRRGRCV
jgi:hypothetical protein